ncbi:Phytochrome-like protein cph1 [anaerobic digester metagenome]|jgi:PAS domain S-box-containing protein|uniref:histidine kinase n=1 Tax=anaerobic digester metagenome TaxID=1263854 RepID=A0A485LUG4_9ZZZZ|nr:ATP-binding protein [Deltaproteobacteria bacterium]HPX17220.1 ATP-binding protein [Deltaproteobacteria bacterium]HRS55157.1 ATP-binding protein [Desulfomonilia bacterium]HRV34916.1 ATP-binding protein [Desulfomonilia bacterium]
MNQVINEIKHIFERAPFAVCAFDRSGTVIYINPLLESNLGPSVPPVMGQSLYEIIHKVLVDERLENNLKRLIDTDKPFSMIVETLSSPGVRASGFINVIGYKLDSVYILIGDFVSGGLSREGRYRQIIEDAPDAIIIMSHGVITFSNPAFNSIMEMETGQVLGREIFEFLDDSGREDLKHLRKEYAKGFFSRFNVNTPSGVKILEGNFHFIEERPGTSIALLRDVTEKVALERRLLRQNQDLTAVNLISKTLSSSMELKEILQNTLAQVLQIMNIETGWIYLLDEKKQELKCAYSHGIPEKVVQSIKKLRIGEGIAGRVAVKGEPIIIENASKDPRISSLAFKKQGIKSFASIPLYSRTRLIGVMNIGSFGERIISPDDERLLITIGVHMGTVMENILLFQEIASTSNELKDAINLIRQRNEELRTLVSTVSHDLKNPIIAINGFCERFLKTAGPKLDKRETEYINAIRESGKRMEKFVTDLLTLSAVENLKLKKEEFPVHELIDEISRELAPQLDSKGGTLVIESPLPQIKADRVRLMQVFSNLITNAIKYANPARDLVISIGYRREPNTHVFSVKDNGLGIPREYAENIFDIFFRGHESHAEGTGIGLSIVKKAVNIMGGEVWLSSEKDQGTVFYFSIPAA